MTDYVFGPFTNWTSSYYQDDYTLRIWIPPSQLTDYPGNFIITFSGSKGAMAIDKVCVGQSSGSELSQDMDADLGIEQVYFDGGSASTSYSGVSKDSDPVTYAIDVTKGLIISVELGAAHSYVPTGPSSGDGRTYYGSGAHGCVSDTSYTSSGYHWLIESIQWESDYMFTNQDTPRVEPDVWTNFGYTAPAAAHALGWAPLPQMTIDAASQCDNLMTADVPFLEIEAQGGELIGVDANLPAIESDSRVADWGVLDEWITGLEIEAQAGERLTLDATLPSLEFEARIGVRGDDLTLPLLEIDATLLQGHIGSLDRLMPGMGCEAFVGANLDSTIPDMELDAAITVIAVGTLDKTIPGLEIEATGVHAGNGTLDIKLPTLLLEGDIGCDPYTSLDEILPGINCAATARYSGMTLDKRIAAITITATGKITAASGTLDSDCPPVIMSGEGYGGSGTGGGYVTNRGRFDDYLLRHSR